jgi:hypothetical protein
VSAVPDRSPQLELDVSVTGTADDELTVRGTDFAAVEFGSGPYRDHVASRERP